MKTVTIPLYEYEEMQSEIKRLEKLNAQKTIEIHLISANFEKLIALLFMLTFIYLITTH